MIAISGIVALLALGLAIGSLAARDNRLIPLIWLHAVLPGIVCFWLLVGPQLLLGRTIRAPVPTA